jgi:hypothetical protein
VALAEDEVITVFLAVILGIDVHNSVKKDRQDVRDGEVSADVPLTRVGNHFQDRAAGGLGTLVERCGTGSGVAV